MKIPLQITFRNMPPSQAIEKNIREKAAKLESLYGRIMGCRVTVEAPHRRHHKGKAFRVRIDLTVPGGELLVNRAPKRLDTVKLRSSEKSENELHESHEPPAHARVIKLIPEERYGFLERMPRSIAALTTHGRTAWVEAILGSVALRVLLGHQRDAAFSAEPFGRHSEDHSPPARAFRRANGISFLWQFRPSTPGLRAECFPSMCLTILPAR